MSTILDALRKLEEERQSRTADVRSRLLFSPAYQTRLLRSHPPAWKTKRNLLSVIGLTVAGFSAGAGFVVWRSYSSQTASTGSVVIPTAPVTEARHESRSASLAASTETFAPERVSDSPLLVEPDTSTSPPPSPPKAQEAALAGVSAVQRSPFVTPPSPPREALPPQKEATPAVKHVQAPMPSSPKHAGRDASSYKVLLPDGMTRSATSPTPAPTPEAAPTPSSGTSLSFLQWSNDPERRIAFLRVNGGPLTMAHEGDTIGGYTVVEIRQNAVELQSGETRMTLRPH